jgi:ferredoxin
MNSKISVRNCKEYDLYEVFDLISDIYRKTDGPEVQGKRVLVKPNILSDNDPAKCIRCFCCSEVCTDDAVEIRRKLFGD